MAEGKLVCEQCGGELEIVSDGIGRCTYNPKHIQKIPRKNTVLFQRAQKLWFEDKDFDGALEVYERIIFENPRESSAHWGVLLCRYGIEYVKDYGGEYLPTCHRIVQESILDDGEYQLALKYADSKVEKLKYQKQAEMIDRYQKKIQAIALHEEPVDVFISFKALDYNGIPTVDSRFADRLYNYMTKELRLKVFFSPVSLEGKTGEFEPYIYAALRSAKVMVLVASSADYVQAVWVRNEWGRFLRILGKDEKKKKMLTVALIGNMTKDKLPSVLRNFPASVINEPDMEMTFCHYIDEYIGEAKLNCQRKKRVVDEKIIKAFWAEQQKKRLAEAEEFLQTEDFKNAEEIFDEIINRSEGLSEAYWGRLKARLQVKNDEELRQKKIADLGKDGDYILAVQYADSQQLIHYQNIRTSCGNAYEFNEKVKQQQEEYDKKYAVLCKAIEEHRKGCSLISEKTRNEMRKYEQISCSIDKEKDIWEKRKAKSPISYIIFVVLSIIFLILLDRMTEYPSRGIVFGLLVCLACIIAAFINGCEKRGKLMGVGIIASFLIFVLIWGILDPLTADRGNLKSVRNIFYVLLAAGSALKFAIWQVRLKGINNEIKSMEQELKTEKLCIRDAAIKDLQQLNNEILKEESYAKAIRLHDDLSIGA